LEDVTFDAIANCTFDATPILVTSKPSVARAGDDPRSSSMPDSNSIHPGATVPACVATVGRSGWASCGSSGAFWPRAADASRQATAVNKSGETPAARLEVSGIPPNLVFCGRSGLERGEHAGERVAVERLAWLHAEKCGERRRDIDGSRALVGDARR